MVYVTLFFSAFVSATLFPLGSEALLLYDIKQNHNVYALLFFATFGNVLGSCVNYYLGAKGEAYLEEKKYINAQRMKRYKTFFAQFGGITLLFSWLPLVGDPLTFMAGVLKYDWKKFLFLVTLAKFGRYLFLTLLLFI